MKGVDHTMDLIIRNAQLRDRKNLVDIAIKDGFFHDIQHKIDLVAEKEIDAKGNLVSPPFVESHIHLDASLTVGEPRFNDSGTLLEGIEIWSERKQNLTKEEIKQRAKTAITWLIANGVLRIRAHTDCTEPDLIPIEAMLELKAEMKDVVDIQIVAFPQDGIFTYEGMDQLLLAAIKIGADVAGGMPQLD